MPGKNRAKVCVNESSQHSVPAPRRRWCEIIFSRQQSRRNRSPNSSVPSPRTALDIIYEWKPEQGYSYRVGDIDSRLGYQKGEYSNLKNGWKSNVHPDDQSRIEAAFENSLASRQPFDEVYRIYRKDQSLRYWRDRGHGIWDAEGNLLSFVGVANDVTAQVQAEQALKELRSSLERRAEERNAGLEALAFDLQRGEVERWQSETKYRIISELTSDFAYVARLNEGGTFIIEWISDQASHIFGYPNEKFATSEQWISMIHPDDRQTAINSLMRSAQGQAVGDEIRFIRPDGSIVWLNISARPVTDPASGRVGSIFGAGQDITERKLAEDALRQNQARYHTLFDESPVSLWEIDLSEVKTALDRLAHDGVTDLRSYFLAHLDEAQRLAERVRVLDVNRLAMKLYDDAVGQQLASFISYLVRDDAQLIFDGLAAIAEGRTFLRLEGKDSKPGRGTCYTEVYFSVVGGYELTYGRVIISILDVTARYRAEQALRQEAQRLELINAITTAALSQNDIKGTLVALAERLRVYAEADDCFITRWDAERHVPIFLAGTGDAEQRIEGHFIAPGETSITRAVMEAGRVLLAQPDDARALNQRVAPAFHRGSALGMPLLVGEQKIGAAVLVYKYPPSIKSEDLDQWEKIAAQVSLAIASLLHYEQARRRADELEKLEQVSSDLRRSQDYAEVLKITLREMVRIVGADRGALIMHHKGRWALEADTTGRGNNELDKFLFTEALIQGILQKADQMVFADPATGIISKVYPWLIGLDALTVIPIKNFDAIIGLVVVGWSKRRELIPEDRRLLTAVAEMAGSAFQRALLLEDLEQRVAIRTRDLQILYDLSALSNRQQGLKKMMHNALKQLIKVLGGDAGAFYELNEDEQLLTIEFSLGIPRRVLPLIDQVPLDLEKWRQVEQYQQPILVPDIRSLKGKPDPLVEHGYDALIWIPIGVAGHLCGIMCVVGSASKLNLEEKPLAMAVADIIAAAAENAQLQKRSKDAAVMEERQRLARALHDSVTQSLYSLTLFSEAGSEYSAAGNQERALHFLERSSATARRALREMRMLLYELRPPDLARLGLVEALRYRLEAVERRIGMEASLSVKHATPIAADVEETLFWIAQEALNNTIKHANASKVSLAVDLEPRKISLVVADNGSGFRADGQPVGGMGLVGMRERALKIGAHLAVESAPGAGTRIEIKLQPQNMGKRKKENG